MVDYEAVLEPAIPLHEENHLPVRRIDDVSPRAVQLETEAGEAAVPVHMAHAHLAVDAEHALIVRRERLPHGSVSLSHCRDAFPELAE